LNLKDFDFGLITFVSTRAIKAGKGWRVGRTKRVRSSRLKHNSTTTSSSLPRISEILPAIHLRVSGQLGNPPAAGTIAYFFITSTLTLFMSTFWLNSGGNLVCRSSFVSTLAAMLTQKRLSTRCSISLRLFGRVCEEVCRQGLGGASRSPRTQPPSDAAFTDTYPERR
jgi:hypothetical protein